MAVFHSTEAQTIIVMAALQRLEDSIARLRQRAMGIDLEVPERGHQQGTSKNW